jgi:hypothetical protein
MGSLPSLRVSTVLTLPTALGAFLVGGPLVSGLALDVLIWATPLAPRHDALAVMLYGLGFWPILCLFMPPLGGMDAMMATYVPTLAAAILSWLAINGLARSGAYAGWRRPVRMAAITLLCAAISLLSWNFIANGWRPPTVDRSLGQKVLEGDMVIAWVTLIGAFVGLPLGWVVSGRRPAPSD